MLWYVDGTMYYMMVQDSLVAVLYTMGTEPGGNGGSLKWNSFVGNKIATWGKWFESQYKVLFTPRLYVGSGQCSDRDFV